MNPKPGISSTPPLSDVDALLQQGEDRFQLLVQSVEDYAIVLLNPAGQIISWNVGAERIKGFTADEVLGRHYSIIFPPAEIQAGVPENSLRQARANSRFADEGWRLRKDGTRYWARSVITSLYGTDGELRGFAKISHDDTRRKAAEEALRDSEARVRAILDSAVDAVITIDTHGTIRDVNTAATRLFGYTAGELLGANVSLLMPAPHRDEHDGYLRNYVQTGVAKIIGIGREVVGKRKDGSTFPMHLAVSEAQLPEQRIFTGMVRDLTDLHRAQQKALQSERLAAIGEMVTGLAHESRNALQRTKACLEMLELELEANSEGLDLLRRVQAAQDHLHHLFEEVRGYAAPLVLKHSKCHLDDIWREAWSILGDGRASRIRFQVHTQTSDLGCEGDRHSLLQLFRIIFENAIAACRDEGAVSLTIHSLEGENPALEVVIRDTGPGFSPEQQARVFEPFYTTKTAGTGLGMAIARRIVDAHQGEISARNWYPSETHDEAGSANLRESATSDSDATQDPGGAEVRIVLPRRLIFEGPTA